MIFPLHPACSGRVCALARSERPCSCREDCIYDAIRRVRACLTSIIAHMQFSWSGFRLGSGPFAARACSLRGCRANDMDFEPSHEEVMLAGQRRYIRRAALSGIWAVEDDCGEQFEQARPRWAEMAELGWLGLGMAERRCVYSRKRRLSADARPRVWASSDARALCHALRADPRLTRRQHRAGGAACRDCRRQPVGIASAGRARRGVYAAPWWRRPPKHMVTVSFFRASRISRSTGRTRTGSSSRRARPARSPTATASRCFSSTATRPA